MRIIGVLVALLVLSGCINPVAEEGRVFTLQTLDRAEDSEATYSLKDNLSEGPVLILFIGVGCIGCKDWTDELRLSHQEWMEMEPPLQLVSIARYPSFESQEDVALEFGTPESNHYTPWPITLPSDEDPIRKYDDETKLSSTVFEYYGMPGTPTLMLIDEDGVTRWKSSTYYPDAETISEIETQYKDMI